MSKLKTKSKGGASPVIVQKPMGRKRLYATNAARQAAYRQRLRKRASHGTR